MKIKSTRGLLALWASFLAAGTWILPTAALLNRAEARPVQVTEEAVSPEVVALYNAARDWLLAGGADLPAYCQDSFDLNHDGVNERIFVSPGSFLGSDGRIVVVDGASGVTRFDLRCPAGEGLFGESIAIAADVSSDGVDDVLVATMTRSTSSGAITGVQARIFSGADGRALGLLSKPVPNPSHTGAPGLTSRRFIGDANGDGTLDLGDVATAVAKLGIADERLPAADMDSDGVLSVADLGVLLDRAVSPDAPLWADMDASIVELTSVYVLVPPVVAGAVSAPTAGILFADLPSGSLASASEPAPPVLVKVNCWLDGFIITRKSGGCSRSLLGAGQSAHPRWRPPRSGAGSVRFAMASAFSSRSSRSGSTASQMREAPRGMKFLGFWSVSSISALSSLAVGSRLSIQMISRRRGKPSENSTSTSGSGAGDVRVDSMSRVVGERLLHGWKNRKSCNDPSLDASHLGDSGVSSRSSPCVGCSRNRVRAPAGKSVIQRLRHRNSCPVLCTTWRAFVAGASPCGEPHRSRTAVALDPTGALVLPAVVSFGRLKVGIDFGDVRVLPEDFLHARSGFQIRAPASRARAWSRCLRGSDASPTIASGDASPSIFPSWTR